MQWLLCFQTAFFRIGRLNGGCFSVWRLDCARLFAWAVSDGRERLNMPSDCQLLSFVVKMGHEKIVKRQIFNQI